ncbi:MAG TPA: hypothetical protein VH414_18230 [Lichenihabitans sp.]|jgi:hypothetical protein|nr:hypothetical protein [Lichenihabitans sp.]
MTIKDRCVFNSPPFYNAGHPPSIRNVLRQHRPSVNDTIVALYVAELNAQPGRDEICGPGAEIRSNLAFQNPTEGADLAEPAADPPQEPI